MIVPIRKMGEACLLIRSSEVTTDEFNQPELLQLIEDLHDTQKHLGGVGIAAPQIGVNKRVVLIEYYQRDITRYSDVGDCPLRVIINPEIQFLSDESSTFNEGCLSVPGLRGEVSRPVGISYKYYDQFGQLHQGEDTGLFARVMQHECDHLDGILYPQRMQDLRKLAFIDVDNSNATS